MDPWTAMPGFCKRFARWWWRIFLLHFIAFLYYFCTTPPSLVMRQTHPPQNLHITSRPQNYFVVDGAGREDLEDLWHGATGTLLSSHPLTPVCPLCATHMFFSIPFALNSLRPLWHWCSLFAPGPSIPLCSPLPWHTPANAIPLVWWWFLISKVAVSPEPGRAECPVGASPLRSRHPSGPKSPLLLPETSQ